MRAISYRKAARPLILAAILVTRFAAAALAADETAFALQPYLWLPTIEAQIGYSTPTGGSGSPEIKADPDDWLDDLTMAALLTAEMRKAKWSFTADFTYLALSSSDASVQAVDFGGSAVTSLVDVGSDVDIKSFVSTFGAGYRIVDTKHLKTDLIVGARYLWLETELDWRLSGDVTGPGGGQSFARSGSVKQHGDIWNGVVGIKGQIGLGDSHWFLPYYADIGTGESDLTWQAFAALAYAFKSWDAVLGYRHMTFEGDDEDLIEEMTFSGPLVGARFRF
jgi:hypothetical protein